MKTKGKSLTKLICMVLVVAAVASWALCGFTVWIYKFVPWGGLVKQGLDLQGGVSALYQVSKSDKIDFAKGMTEVMDIIQNRLSAKGYTEAAVSKEGTDRIRVEIPSVSEPGDVFSLIGQPGKLEFKDEAGTVLLTGEDVESASYAGLAEGKYHVSLNLTAEGTTKFATATTNNVGKTIAIVLDGKQQSAPKVDSAITTGKADISSSTESDARSIVTVLQSGSMPLEITELEASTVSATLGEQALQVALVAGAIGSILVLLFMIAYYRLPGLLANLALIIYLLIFYLFVAQFPWIQLTLPAIAGIILSVGMAVDANVVIFERIKDEYANGKSLQMAVDIGYAKALTAIVDSNVTTIIAAVVMLIFGLGPVRNFAVTLLAGVIISMFTAVFVTRYIMKLAINAGLATPRNFGLKAGDKV